MTCYSVGMQFIGLEYISICIGELLRWMACVFQFVILPWMVTHTWKENQWVLHFERDILTQFYGPPESFKWMLLLVLTLTFKRKCASTEWALHLFLSHYYGIFKHRERQNCVMTPYPVPRQRHPSPTVIHWWPLLFCVHPTIPHTPYQIILQQISEIISVHL